tara:strand:- start:115 stop:339 length:225 start_codon:yes stop_codon:yes gene_type:complete
MFEIGDLVRFKKEGAFTKTREHPAKQIGLIIDLERNVFLTYEGDYDDQIQVYWMPYGEKESMPEFLLEKVEDNT